MLWSFRSTFLLGLIWPFGLFVVAPNTDPKLSDDEKGIYHNWNMDYQLHYNPYRYNPKRTPYLMHLLPAHPNLQQDALEHARITGYGPYVVEHKRGVSYAMTMIPGDREVAHRWNLRQNDKTAVDINVMWKIDHNGAKMLRFDAWTAGARAHQVASMQELIDSYKPRARP